MVLGSGYVGLPTATIFAEAGFNVVAVDVKQEVVDTINSGISPSGNLDFKKLLNVMSWLAGLRLH